jgi:hypothetical protein
MKKFLIISFLIISICSMMSCGGGSGSSSSGPGTNTGVPSNVQLMPAPVIAQTNSAITFYAKITDGNGSFVRNTPVRFTSISPIGVLYDERDVQLTNPVVKTNKYGIAAVRLKSFIEGFATVQAEVNKGIGVVRDRKTVYFATNTNLQPYVILEVDGGNNILFENSSDNEVVIKATVFNRFGQRAFGSVVTFGADMPYKVGSATTCSDATDACEVSFPQGNKATTNSSGEASVLVRVDPLTIRSLTTVLNITASADNGAANLISLFLNPVTIANVIVTANPTVIAPDKTSTVIAAVKLNTGAPVPNGTNVSFIASCGAVTPFAQTTDGAATAIFTAPSVPPSSGSCEVTASVGDVSSSPPAVIFVTSTLTVQPATLTINGAAGGTGTYTIFGGVAPYAVISDSPLFAPNPASVTTNGGTFSVTVPPSTPAGTVNLTVRDAVGTIVAVKLTITAGPSLSVQPGTQTIDGAVGGDATFSIFGGSPPYNVFSNTPSFPPDPATVSASGRTFAVHVSAGSPAASVTYTVRDSLGATSTATLTITEGGGGTTGLVLVPGSVSVIGATGDTVTFTVSGGTPDYVITSTDPANAYNTTAGNGVWNVTASGGTFPVTVPAGAPDETVTLNAFDSLGNTKAVTITITGGGAAASGLAVTPASISLTGLSGTTDEVTFIITNGTPGYTMFSSNTAVVPNASVSGSAPYTFTVNPQPVSTTTAVPITVVDNVGAIATTTVTITPASSSMAVNPSTIAVFGSVPVSFNIIGGLPSFKVYSSDTSIVTLGSNPITLLGRSFTASTTGTGGSATITIVDSDGKTVTATVTVTAPPAPVALSVAPPTATICEDNITCSAATDVALFTITGGTPPYTVTSLIPIVIPSPGPLGGNSFFTVNALNGSIGADTPVFLTVEDSAAGFVSVTVTVINQ